MFLQFGAGNVVPGVARIGSHISEPGVVKQTGTFAHLQFAESDGRPSARTTAFYNACKQAGFDATKAVAAAAASASGLPAIERDVSRASTTFLQWPRLIACSPTTGRPFSSSCGAVAEAAEVTTVAPTDG